MGAPLIYEVLETPATASIVFVCCLSWLWINWRGIDYEDIGLSYEKVVEQGHYWRAVTASLSHVNLLHLAFNMSSLWTCRFVELTHGPIFYFKFSFLLLVLSVVVILLLYHVLITRFHKEHYRHSLAVGYSCVVFGWMTVVAQWSPSPTIPIFGFPVPIALAPFTSLILTSLIIPNASFIGHLSGILIGFLIAWDAFSWFDDRLFFYSLIWASILFVYSLAKTTSVSFPFLVIEPTSDLESQHR